MTESQNRSNFWTTLPGILTGVAALLTAVGGLWVALHSPAPHPNVDALPAKVGATQPQARAPQPGGNAQQPAHVVPHQPPPAVNKPQAIITEDEGNTVTVNADSLTWMGQKEMTLNNGQSIRLDKIETISILNVSDSNTSLRITLTSGTTINDSVNAGRYSPYFYGFGGNNDTGGVLVKIDKVKQVMIEH